MEYAKRTFASVLTNVENTSFSNVFLNSGKRAKTSAAAGVSTDAVSDLGMAAAGGGVSFGGPHSSAMGPLRVRKMSPAATIPARGSPGAAGYDLSAAHEATVPPHKRLLVKTDLAIAIPEGTYARIAPRSGLAFKKSIDVAAGVVDYDYRGNVGVILVNHADEPFEVKVGDRIAQLILEKIATPDVVEVDDLEETDRGAGGFGSTGVAAKPTA